MSKNKLCATEYARKLMVSQLNARFQGLEPEDVRIKLEAEYGKIWTTKELVQDFDVIGFAAPFCLATRKSDQKKGSLMFIHRPRFYFGFEPVES